MFARISTRLACTEAQLWRRIIEPKSLRFVASPILGFVPVETGAFDGKWQVGRAYPLKLYFMKFIPLGRHTLQLVKIDKHRNIISSRESGTLTPVWNHNISFQEVAPGVVNYTDEIEIRAGWRTPFIWLFAHVFYRHRQQRWKRLLQEEGDQGEQAKEIR